MSKTTKNIIGLCVVVLVIAAMAAVYFLSGEGSPEEISVAVEPHNLISRQETELVRVSFTDAEGTHSFAQADAGWTWEEHPSFILNPEGVSVKVQIAQTITATETMEGHLNLADFGLNPPALVVEVEYTDGTSTTINIGSETADLRGRFVTITNDPNVYIIPARDAWEALIPPQYLLDTTLPLATIHAQYILIDPADGQTIELTMDSDMTELAGMPVLIMAQPLHNWPLADALETEIIDRLNQLAITGVANANPENLEPYGLYDPKLEIFFVDSTGTFRLLFGGMAGDEIYVKFANRPHVFTMPFAVVEPLLNLNIFRFIDRFFTLINIMEVEAVEITGVDPTRNVFMEINHVEDSMDIAPTVNGTEISDQDFRRLYQLVIGVQAEGFASDIAPGAQPELTITYHLLTGGTREVAFYAMDANFYVAVLNGEYPGFATSRLAVQIMFDRIAELLE